MLYKTLCMEVVKLKLSRFCDKEVKKLVRLVQRMIPKGQKYTYLFIQDNRKRQCPLFLVL